MDGVADIPLTRPKIFPVAVENVLPIWPEWEPLLVRALRGTETHEPIDVRRMVMAEQAHLWVQWSGRLDAFVVSEFAHYPRGKWLRIWLCAAREDVPLDEEAFVSMLSHCRDANGCRGFEVIGRIGWMRRFPGAQMVGVMLRSTT